MGVHATTHIDAPWHYNMVVDGTKAKTIDQVPLEWLYGNGVVIDVRHIPDFQEITIDDLQKNLSKNNIKLQAGNIVLINNQVVKITRQRLY